MASRKYIYPDIEKIKNTLYECFFKIGGKAEIRTLGGVAPSTVFKTAALNRSATFPSRLRKTFTQFIKKGQVFFSSLDKLTNNY